ncbi:MAG: hypothetical protein IIB22_06595 [Chloroflexi bacterium]|nr:hypothetical protein [Chloroflexota bacterium]
MRRERLVPVVRTIVAAGILVGVAAFLWLGVGSQSSTPASAATFLITVGNNWFCDSSFQNGDCELAVGVNDEVTWLFDSAVAHTTTECTGSCGSVIGNPGTRLWDSGPMTSGSLSRTFDTPGVFQYQCNIHPLSMRGTIIVSGAPPTLPMPPSPLPTETETPVPTLPMPPSPAPSETDTPVPTDTAVPGPVETDTPVPTNTPVPTSTPAGLRGDVNGDGQIDAIDAALVLQFGAGLLPALPNFDRADVNGNGMVDAIDAALILQFSAGLLNTL